MFLPLSLPYHALFIIEKILFFVLYVALASPIARVESDPFNFLFNTMHNASLKIRTKSSGRRGEARGEDGRETIELK